MLDELQSDMTSGAVGLEFKVSESIIYIKYGVFIQEDTYSKVLC